MRISSFAQSVFSCAEILARPGGRYRVRIVWRVAGKIASTLSGQDDLVRVKWCGSEIYAPVAAPVNYIRSISPNYDKSLAWIARAVTEKYPGAPIIDVGANIGDTAVLIQAESADSPILCIEASSKFYPILCHNVESRKNIKCVQAFLGERMEVRQGQIQEHDGTGGFVASDSTVKINPLGDLLKDHPDFIDAKLLKIDTDGFDSQIIRGALPWLKERKPVLFWECDPATDAQASGYGRAIFDDLKEAGYEKFIFFTNTGEIACVCNSADSEIIDDLYHLFVCGAPVPYGDVAAFSHDDLPLIETVRSLFRANSQKPSKT